MFKDKKKYQYCLTDRKCSYSNRDMYYVYPDTDTGYIIYRHWFDVLKRILMKKIKDSHEKKAVKLEVEGMLGLIAKKKLINRINIEGCIVIVETYEDVARTEIHFRKKRNIDFPSPEKIKKVMEEIGTEYFDYLKVKENNI